MCILPRTRDIRTGSLRAANHDFNISRTPERASEPGFTSLVPEGRLNFSLVQISYFDRLMWAEPAKDKPSLKAYRDQSRRDG